MVKKKKKMKSAFDLYWHETTFWRRFVFFFAWSALLILPDALSRTPAEYSGGEALFMLFVWLVPTFFIQGKEVI